MENDALRLHLRNPALDMALFHLEVGDAVTQQAAGLGVPLIDMHLVPGACELLGAGEPRRTRATHGDRLARAPRRRLGDDPSLLPAAIDDGAFDRLDRD